MKPIYLTSVVIFALICIITITPSADAITEEMLGDCAKQVGWESSPISLYGQASLPTAFGPGEDPIEYYTTLFKLLSCLRDKDQAYFDSIDQVYTGGWLSFKAIHALGREIGIPMYKLEDGSLAATFQFEEEKIISCGDTLRSCTSACGPTGCKDSSCYEKNSLCIREASIASENEYKSLVMAWAAKQSSESGNRNKAGEEKKEEVSDIPVFRDIPEDKKVAKVMKIKGEVYVTTKENERFKLTKGSILSEGDIVSTEAGASVTLLDTNAALATFGENTIVGLGKPIEEGIEYEDKIEEMEIFEMMYKVIYGLTQFETPEGRKFCVEGTAIICVRGTKFIVKLDKIDQATSVHVLEGEVEFSDMNKQKTVILKPGETSKTEANGLPSQPKKYENEEVSIMLKELGIKKERSYYLWIAIGILLCSVVAYTIKKRIVKKLKK